MFHTKIPTEWQWEVCLNISLRKYPNNDVNTNKGRWFFYFNPTTRVRNLRRYVWPKQNGWTSTCKLSKSSPSLSDRGTNLDFLLLFWLVSDIFTQFHSITFANNTILTIQVLTQRNCFKKDEWIWATHEKLVLFDSTHLKPDWIKEVTQIFKILSVFSFLLVATPHTINIITHLT